MDETLNYFFHILKKPAIESNLGTNFNSTVTNNDEDNSIENAELLDIYVN